MYFIVSQKECPATDTILFVMFPLKISLLFIVYFILFFFCFLWPHPQHMEVPRLGVELELQVQAYTTAIAMLDPWPTEWGQESNTYIHGYYSDMFPLHHSENSHKFIIFWIPTVCITLRWRRQKRLIKFLIIRIFFLS